MIIDRGQIVANGTPDELKRKSEAAGAVTIRLSNGERGAVIEELKRLPNVQRCVVVSESPLAIRVNSTENASGKLGAAIGELALARRWQIEELHTEEGRLDEVFRSITLPETQPKENR
jgi:ABC-2 type transport system ATP-binding protein